MPWLGELGRKAIHFSALIIPVGYYLLPEGIGRTVLVALVVASLIIDVVRLNEPRIRTFFYLFFGRMVRDHERYNLLGSTYLLLSSLICVYAFSKPVAVAALGFLIVGDSSAAIVGRAIGRVRILGKTLEGSLACLVACLIVVWVVPDIGLRQGIIGAVMATVFELLPVPLDDNLRIPIAAGFAMTLAA